MNGHPNGNGSSNEILLALDVEAVVFDDLAARGRSTTTSSRSLLTRLKELRHDVDFRA
jgi:hypothetical protein